MATVLERKPIAIPKVERALSDELSALAEEASTLLGYDAVKERYKARKRTHTRRELIAAAFDAVGIQPYDKKTVEKYKQQAKREAEGPYWLRNFCLNDVGENLMGCSGVAGVVSLIVMIAIAGNSIVDGRVVKHWNWWGAAGAFGLICLWWAIAYIRNCIKPYRSTIHYEWNSIRLSHYGKEIPAFAIAHAVALQKSLLDNGVSKAEFSWQVEDLSQYNTHVPVPDPFLVLAFDEEVYYVDVWGEPKFEAKEA